MTLPPKAPENDAPVIPSIAPGTVFPHAGGDIDITVIPPFEYIPVGGGSASEGALASEVPPQDPVAFLELLRPAARGCCGHSCPTDQMTHAPCTRPPRQRRSSRSTTASEISITRSIRPASR